MKTDLEKLIFEITKKNELYEKEKKRKEFFKSIGRKGGLVTKKTPKLDKRITVRFTEDELMKIKNKAQKNNLDTSVFIRMVVTENELRINEFQTEEILLSYATNFKRIRNLLQSREWNAFPNKKEILENIDLLLSEMMEYLINHRKTRRFEQ